MLVKFWKDTPTKYILFFITFGTICLFASVADASNRYNGEWDLPAKSVADLCYIVHNNLPPETDVPTLPKSAYLRRGECWKYKWNPCDDVDSKEEYIGPDSKRPCGYYQMVAAPLHECD